MSKTTNKQQLQHLLTLMEANADIACGFYKGSKEALSRFWKRVETELNSMGPPTKCHAEWKKVWADQKKYVRQKAAQNLREKKATGGGPNKEVKFSSIEEGIYTLVGMKSAVEGVATKSYSLNSPKTQEDIIETYLDAVFLEDEVSQVQEKPKEVPEKTPRSTTKFPTFQKLALNKELEKSSYDVLQAGVEVQKDLVKTMKGIAENQKEQQQHSKRIYRSLEKLHESNDKHFKKMEELKQEEIEEMRRHNVFMEKQRVREVEYKLEKNRLEMQLR